MLKRRCIGTAHNFANKPVPFACNGVQIRQRVSYKAGTKEDGRTARNSRNASRARKKILQKAARKAACVPDDRRKASRRVVWHPGRTTAARHGEGTKGRGRGCEPWGGYRGEDRSKSGRQTGRHDEAKRFGVSEWCGCSSSRVRIYIAAIYSIFIYILSIYL